MADIREVDIDGATVRVDAGKATTWHFLKLSAKTQDERLADAEKLPYVVELVEYLLADGMDELLSALGGEDAPAQAVMDAFSRVMEAVTPKA